MYRLYKAARFTITYIEKNYNNEWISRKLKQNISCNILRLLAVSKLNSHEHFKA